METICYGRTDGGVAISPLSDFVGEGIITYGVFEISKIWVVLKSILEILKIGLYFEANLSLFIGKKKGKNKSKCP